MSAKSGERDATRVNNAFEHFLRSKSGHGMLTLSAEQVKLLSASNRVLLLRSFKSRALKSLLRSGVGYESVGLGHHSVSITYAAYN